MVIRPNLLKMTIEMPKNIIADTGFWIAYFNERDQYHNDAIKEGQFIFKNKIICPSPSFNKKSMNISLVDLVINQIIRDINVKIDYMITFNKKDFYINCSKRNIKILPEI